MTEVLASIAVVTVVTLEGSGRLALKALLLELALKGAVIAMVYFQYQFQQKWPVDATIFFEICVKLVSPV